MNYFHITRRFLLFLWLLSLVSHFSMQSRISDKRKLKGLFDSITDTKKHLSPFHGFIWIESDLLEKFYQWGNANVVKDEQGIVKTVKRKGTDPTMYLIIELFHLVHGHFGATEVSTKPATYFTPDVIGNIVSLIDTLEGVEEGALKKAQKKLATIIFTAMKPIIAVKVQADQELDNFGNQAAENVQIMLQHEAFKTMPKKTKTKYFNFGTKRKEWKKSLINLSKETDGTIKRLFANLNLTDGEKDTYAKTMIDLSNNFKTLQENQKKNTRLVNLIKGDAGYLAHMTIESLKESGHIKLKTPRELRYPQYTTHAIFLSLLYDKTEKMDDFMEYFKQFTPGILKANVTTLLAQQFADIDEKTKISNQVTHNWKNNPLNTLMPFFKKNYEQIVYEAINALSPIVPPLVRYQDIRIMGEEFANCGITTLINFMQIIMAKLNIYDASTKRFDIENMQAKLQSYFTQHTIVFDQSKMEKNLDPFIAFLKEFNHGSITSGELFHKKLTALLSNIPGIKYLRRVKKDGTEKSIKDNSLPAVHETSNTKGTYQALDDTWYLVEMSGYPSTFIEYCNHLFGLNIQSFKALCDTFGFSIKIGDGKSVEDITDMRVYDDYYKKKIHSIQKPILSTTINNEPFSVQIVLSDAHSSIKLLQETYEDKFAPVLDIVIPHMHDIFIFRNLAALYPFAKQTMAYRTKLLKPEVHEQAMLKYLAMTTNIEAPKIQSQIINQLVIKNKTADETLLGNLTGKLISSVIKTKDDEGAITILKGIANKNHNFSKTSLILMHQAAQILNTDYFKRLGCEELLRAVYTHDWQQLVGPELEDIITDIEGLFKQLNEYKQQEIAIKTLTKAHFTKHHNTLIPLLKTAMQQEPMSLSYIGKIVEALAHSGDLFDEDTKATLLNRLIPRIDSDLTVFTTFQAIITQQIESAYDQMIYRLAQVKWDSRYIFYEKLSMIAILEQHPHIHPTLAKFFDKAFNENYLSYTILKLVKKEDLHLYQSDQDEAEKYGIEIAKKIIEINYKQAYTAIKHYFKRLPYEIAEKKREGLVHAFQLLIFMIDHHIQQNEVILEEKQLLDDCMVDFFTSCLEFQIQYAWENYIQPILKLIEERSTPDFNGSIIYLRRMFPSKIKQIENTIQTLKKQNQDIQEMENLLEQFKEVKEPLRKLITKILEF